MQAARPRAANAVHRMKRTLILLVLAALSAVPARAETVTLAPPFTGSFTAEGCSMDGRSLPYPGTCTVIHEPNLNGQLRAGVSMGGFADGLAPSVGRGESVAKLTIGDAIAAGAVPSYDATFEVLESASSRSGLPAGATGDRLVHALLRVVDPRPRCAGEVHGSLPGALVAGDQTLTPGAVFTLRVDTPARCVRSAPATLQIEATLFVRVAISDRGALPGGAAGYEMPGFGTVSALGAVKVTLTRTT